MRGLRTTLIVGAITFTAMIFQLGENAPGASALDAMPGAAVSAETAGAPPLSAAISEPPAGPETNPGAEPGAVPAAVSAPALTAQTEIARADPIERGESLETGSVDTKSVDLGQHDVAQPVPTLRGATDGAAKPAPVKDFRYLIYYVWSELPPAEKPAEIILRSLKDIPVGTPVEEIKRACDALGLDFNFMKAVAKIESGFDPKQRTGSYIGLFQLSKYEFGKFGFGQILDPRDNSVAAAYKVITEGILFEWVTHKKPTLSDLYLIHQQGWEGAAEHISRPDRIAWKSMCATSEGREKGEKWCKRAIWRNTLPAVKDTWKSVEKLTSGAFVGMWHDRLAEFYSKYMTAATAAAERASQ